MDKPLITTAARQFHINKRKPACTELGYKQFRDLTFQVLKHAGKLLRLY